MTTPLAVTTQPLAAATTRALGVQGALLVLAALVLPALVHAAGMDGAALLPMHWPVLLAGLCYGSRAGALLGASAPLVAFAVSGMPPLFVQPAMITELATYGAVAGLARGARPWRLVAATTAALVLGRAAFVGVMAIEHGEGANALAGLAAGRLVALAQLVVLPLVATWWIRRESARG